MPQIFTLFKYQYHNFSYYRLFKYEWQALTLAMCPLARMPFWGCRASSGHHNWFSTGPRGQWIFFLVLRMPPLFLLGIGKTRKATLIRPYFSLYIGLMYKSVQLHAWNHKFPPRKHLGHYMFLGGQWFFWGASGFSDSLAPRASGCHSPMSRPEWHQYSHYFQRYIFNSKKVKHTVSIKSSFKILRISIYDIYIVTVWNFRALGFV